MGAIGGLHGEDYDGDGWDALAKANQISDDLEKCLNSKNKEINRLNEVIRRLSSSEPRKYFATREQHERVMKENAALSEQNLLLKQKIDLANDEHRETIKVMASGAYMLAVSIANHLYEKSISSTNYKDHVHKQFEMFKAYCSNRGIDEKWLKQWYSTVIEKPTYEEPISKFSDEFTEYDEAEEVEDHRMSSGDFTRKEIEKAREEILK